MSDDGVEDSFEAPEMPLRPTRLAIPEELFLEVIDEKGNILASERTITENISLRGAAVFSQSIAEVGSFLRVTSLRHQVSLISIVRGKRLGTDKMSRLHLEFIDAVFPLEGIA